MAPATQFSIKKFAAGLFLNFFFLKLSNLGINAITYNILFAHSMKRFITKTYLHATWPKDITAEHDRSYLNMNHCEPLCDTM